MTAMTKSEFEVNFKYIPTADNLASYITRELTLKRFNEKFPHWCRGPLWIIQEELLWNYFNLGCFSEDQKKVFVPL